MYTSPTSHKRTISGSLNNSSNKRLKTTHLSHKTVVTKTKTKINSNPTRKFHKIVCPQYPNGLPPKHYSSRRQALNDDVKYPVAVSRKTSKKVQEPTKGKSVSNNVHSENKNLTKKSNEQLKTQVTEKKAKISKEFDEFDDFLNSNMDEILSCVN